MKHAISQPVPITAESLGFVGNSQYIKQLRQQIQNAAGSAIPVFISGNAGTAKDSIAEAIHACGSKQDRQLTSVNCASVPCNKQEEEFLGMATQQHGGTKPHKSGLLAQANHSTLLLKEIDALDSTFQNKLLKIIKTGEFVPLWAKEPRIADMRFICTSNDKIESNIDKGLFSLDLFKQLSTLTITTIPLHDHREDIPELIDHIITQKDDPMIPRRIAPMALELLVEHYWPGNIRELKYTVEVICIASMGYKSITEKTVRSVLKINDAESSQQVSYQEAKAAALHDFETRYFTKLLNRFKGNANQASLAAGMYRPNLLNKLKQLGISPQAFKRKAHRVIK